MVRQKDDTKIQAIHDAAMRLVIKTGFAGLKMAEVAETAGMATGTLYIYYKSKEELINAVYYETKQEIMSVLLNPAHIQASFYETYRSMWFEYFDFCFQNPEKMLFVEQFIYSGYISEERIAIIEKGFEPLNEFLRQGQQASIVVSIDIELLKAQIQGALHEVIKILIRQKQTASTDDKEKLFGMSWASIQH